MLDVWHMMYSCGDGYKGEANIIASTAEAAVQKLKDEFQGFSISILGEPEHSTISEYEYENN